MSIFFASLTLTLALLFAGNIIRRTFWKQKKSLGYEVENKVVVLEGIQLLFDYFKKARRRSQEQTGNYQSNYYSSTKK